MTRGPLGAPRPFGIGPLTSSEEEKKDQDFRNIEDLDDPTAQAVLEMANAWYDSITEDQSKHKMMKNFLLGVTELSEERIDEILQEAEI